MATEQDVLAAVKASAIVIEKAAIVELAKDGGVLDLQLDVAAAQIPYVGSVMEGALKPVIKQAIATYLATLG